ncbi:hypothetical protein HN924_02415 [Candidatus Woesearchaeota archaeon]|jgi:hypothetical protein|nr:hypothetical protein [Candidatus Woesearchaeota archaeon]MBT7062798.1 hypothetical protein [Candidatus Woesearchaeota archaeon]MBT7403040.1 hypothetical protein [Candidatus Woesearchaeota archaeon]
MDEESPQSLTFPEYIKVREVFLKDQEALKTRIKDLELDAQFKRAEKQAKWEKFSKLERSLLDIIQTTDLKHIFNELNALGYTSTSQKLEYNEDGLTDYTIILECAGRAINDNIEFKAVTDTNYAQPPNIFEEVRTQWKKIPVPARAVSGAIILQGNLDNQGKSSGIYCCLTIDSSGIQDYLNLKRKRCLFFFEDINSDISVEEASSKTAFIPEDKINDLDYIKPIINLLDSFIDDAAQGKSPIFVGENMYGGKPTKAGIKL